MCFRAFIHGLEKYIWVRVRALEHRYAYLSTFKYIKHKRDGLIAMAMT